MRRVPDNAAFSLVQPLGSTPVAVAHRGYSNAAPENTLAAIAAAIAVGVAYIEIDTHATRDGVPVIMHDATVDRTSDGSGAVAELTAAEVTALDAGSWFSPAFAGQRVPTLGAVLDLIRGSGSRLLMEVKLGQSRDQVAAMLAEIETRSMADEVVVQSFDEQVLRTARELGFDRPLGLLRSWPDDDPVTAAKAVDAAAYNPREQAVLDRPDLVASLHDAGIAIMPWTVNDPASWRALAELGVDGIITDRAGQYEGWRLA